MLDAVFGTQKKTDFYSHFTSLVSCYAHWRGRVETTATYFSHMFQCDTHVSPGYQSTGYTVNSSDVHLVIWSTRHKL